MVLDVPAPLLRLLSISISMDTNHGLAESTFSGQQQVQRGALERFSFTATLRRMNRKDAQTTEAFFCNLEGVLNTFRTPIPGRTKPLGHGLGLATLSADHTAGTALVTLAGVQPGTYLHPADYLQIGNQLCKVLDYVVARPDGTATAKIWPRLYTDLPSNTRVVAQSPKGIFRMTADTPTFDATAANLLRQHDFKFSGTQVILLGTETPIPLGWT